MTSRDVALLLFAWIGSVFIALGVYEWRQDNDLGDLADRVSDLEGGISSIGDRGPDFEPESAVAGDLTLQIVSTSGTDENIPGIIDAPGSLVMRVTNAGIETVVLSDLEVFATATDGLACLAYRDFTQSVGAVGPQQADEFRVLWDCDNLAVITVQGAEFRPLQ